VPEPEDGEADHSSPAQPAHTDVAALYNRYHAVLHRQAKSTLPEYLQDQVDDALMTVFTRLRRHEQAGTLAEQANWEAYLVKAVKNACLDIIKNFPANAGVDADDARIYQPVAADPTGDAVTERLDDNATLRRARAALDTLDPRLHDIVIAKLQGRTNRDIGTQHDITGQRVGQLYVQAMRIVVEEVTRTDD